MSGNSTATSSRKPAHAAVPADVTAPAADQAGRRGLRILGRRVTRRAGTLCAALAAAGGLALAIAPAASATTVDGLPTMSCYRSATGGTIVGSKLVVADDGGTTTYAAYVYRWTSGGWAEVGPMYTSDGHYLMIFQDTAYGSLAEEPVSLAVPHGYYQVVYIFRTTGDSSSHYAYAEVRTSSTEYSVNICQL